MRFCLTICSAVLLFACGGEDAGGGGGFPAPLVETAVVEQGDLVGTWSFSATVSAPRSSVLATAATGRVQVVRRREGESAAKGDVLVRLDAGNARAAVDGAEADVAAAEAEVERTRTLWERAQALGERLSDEERDDARLRADVAAAIRDRRAADLRARSEELADHVVRAPYPAVVTARLVDEGAWVTPGAPLLEVIERGDPELRVGVPAARLPFIAKDMVVEVRSGLRRFEGRVAAVVPAVDPDTRQGLVRVVMVGEDLGDLLPGAPVEVSMEVRLATDALLVRREALQDGGHGMSVIAVVEGKAVPVAVRVLEQAGGRSAVEGEGLQVGMKVVVRGAGRLRPDSEVREVGAQQAKGE